MAVTLRTWRSALVLALFLKLGNAQTTKQTFKVTTILADPFTMVDYQNTTKGNVYKGFVIDVLMELKKQLDVDFEINLVADGSYGSLDKEGNWKGMIGQLVRGEVDIAAAPLTVTARRSKYVDFTQPYMLTGPQILMKKPPRFRPTIFMLLFPFSSEVWIAILFGYVIVSICLHVFWRWSPFEWRSVASVTDHEVRESFNIPNSFFFTISTILNQGYRLAPRSLSGRLLSATWWIFAIFILVAYTASLTGLFIVRGEPSKRIDSFDALGLSDLSYGFFHDGSVRRAFEASKDPLRKKMLQKVTANPSNMVKSNSDGIKKVRKSRGRYAFILETPFAEYAASLKPCDLYVTGERLTNNVYAFACRKGSGICDKLNVALLSMQESSRLHDLRLKWFFSGECEETKEKVKVRSSLLATTFTLNDSAFAFLLLVIGIGLSLVVFGLEIFLNSKGIVVPSTSGGRKDEVRMDDPAAGM